MGGRDEASERADLVVTLFVLDALGSVRQHPLQLRDLERTVYFVIKDAVNAGELQPTAFLQYDPSGLFGQLQELRQCDFVERKPGGYELTAAGRNKAQSWTQKMFSPATVTRLREGVTAGA